MSATTITRTVPDVHGTAVRYGTADQVQCSALVQYECEAYPALYTFTGSIHGGPITVTHKSGMQYHVSRAARDRVDPGGTFGSDPDSWVRCFLS